MIKITPKMKVGKLWFVICVWLFFMHGSCLCRFVYENNCLKVSSPENLKGTYECAIGNFSVPEYAGTLSGIVVYPKTNRKGCKSFTHEISFEINAPGSLPMFLLVDRGDCYMMFKALNAQNAGAAAILIVNDIHDYFTTMYLSEEEGVDHYYPLNISIPLALISRSLGDSIKKALNNNDFVRANLEWTEASVHMDEQVEHEFRKNINDDCRSRCDNQIQEHEPLGVHPMWHFMIKSTPLWGFLIRYIWS